MANSKPQCSFDKVHIEHGYYIVKFNVHEDHEKVFGKGSWMIFDHYLTVYECLTYESLY